MPQAVPVFLLIQWTVAAQRLCDQQTYWLEIQPVAAWLALQCFGLALAVLVLLALASVPVLVAPQPAVVAVAELE